MPCYTSPDEIEYYEKEANKATYNIEKTDAQIIASVACSLAKSIRKHNLFDEQEKFVKIWILNHEKLDKELAASKLSDEQKRVIRKQALSKLSKTERESLNLI
jgi:hypothetical protein